MKGKKFGKVFLSFFILLTIGTLPITLRKPPIKDWILVYLYNAVTNVIIDKILTTLNVVKYPVRLFSKFFDISIVFDLFVYPFITILYNQLTYKDKPFAIVYKIFLFAFPMLIFELWLEKKTSLIKWKKGWNWYHTFFSIILKSLFTRMIIGTIRKVEKHQEKYGKQEAGTRETLEPI
ncbi:hypothetical protein BTR23_12395 [Alkalihalophilus pseudofirmus]|nr:hypothetical protein BTR23_12395 [Alkalihalophilus pseudofirmus]